MDDVNTIIQQRVANLKPMRLPELHAFRDVPKDFVPWASGLSPSALYNCSLTCRKKAKMKTTEVRFMSIKRWCSVTSNGIKLPEGVFLSIKRREEFNPFPTPHFEQKEYVLMMFPYGNVWSQRGPDYPITEEWLLSDDHEGVLILDALMRKDAAAPLPGYFKSCHEYMINNPDQIGIHLKRKQKEVPPKPPKTGRKVPDGIF